MPRKKKKAKEAKESSIDKIINYLKLNYKRLYTLTYTPSRENILRALEVYKFCMENGLFRSIDACVAKDLEERKRTGRPTYSYRRMENFIKELGLYKVDGYWMMVKWLIKLTPGYESEEVLTQEEIEEIGSGETTLEAEKITVDVNFITYAPPLDMEEYGVDADIDKDVRRIIETEIKFNPSLTDELVSAMLALIENKVWEISLFEPFTAGNVTYYHYKTVEHEVDYNFLANVKFLDVTVKIRGGKIVEREEEVRREYNYSAVGTLIRWIFYPFNLVPKTAMLKVVKG